MDLLSKLNIYLPFQLKVEFQNEIYQLEVINHVANYIRLLSRDKRTVLIQTNEKSFNLIKPLLMPVWEVSDNDSEFGIRMRAILKSVNWICLSLEHHYFMDLVRNGYDVYNLIEQGKAKDISEVSFENLFNL